MKMIQSLLIWIKTTSSRQSRKRERKAEAVITLKMKPHKGLSQKPDIKIRRELK